jgi:hypothetical protein
MKNLEQDLHKIKNPLTFLVWSLIYIIWSMLHIGYKILLSCLSSIVIPILNAILSLLKYRIIIGKSQSNGKWEHHYMLACQIKPWERFSCQDNKYKSLFRILYN